MCKNRITILAYVPFGSYSLGLNSRVLDLDFLGIYQNVYSYDKNAPLFLYEKPLPEEILKIDWLTTDITLLQNVTNCDIPYHKLFETHLGFAKSWLINHSVFDYTSLPGDNSCKLASVLSDMCYYGNGYITDITGCIVENKNEFKKTLRVYDFCKRRFVSVAGRLEKYMVQPGNVRLRSYLYSLNELHAIKYALENAEFPKPFFIENVNSIGNEIVRHTAIEYYERNSKSENIKEKLLIDPNLVLNDYIYEQINQIKPKLKQLFNEDRNTVFDIEFV